MSLTPTQPARGRAQPWTIWELIVIGVSAVLIGVPLLREAVSWIAPERAPAQTSSSVPTSNDLRIGLAGNWGSAYIGDVIRLTVVTGNDHADAAMSDVSVLLTLPPSLELVGAEADRGTALAAPNGVSYGPFNLDSGDSSTLRVDVRVAADAQQGSVLVSQAQGSFSGADSDSFSNVVTVLVIGAAPTTSATTLTEPTAAAPEPTVAPTDEPTVAPTDEPTVAPTDEPTATATDEPTANIGTVAGGTAATPEATAAADNATAEPTGSSSVSAPAGGSSGSSQTSVGSNPTTAPAAAGVQTAGPTIPAGVPAGGVSQGSSALAVPTPLLNPTSAAGGSAVVAAGGTAATSSRLPETNAGIPIVGLLLMGGTLLTRTVRLHRARERV